MMRCVMLPILAAMMGVPEFEELPGTMLREGEHHREDISYDVAREWWALLGTETGFELRAVTLTVESLSDDDPVHPSGKRVIIPGLPLSEHSVFLVQGIEGLRAGPVRTVFEGVIRMEPGYPIRLGGPSAYVEGRPYIHTNVFASGPMLHPDSCCKSDDYRLGVQTFTRGADGSRESKEQTLLSVEDGSWPAISDDKLPEVHWIGDLDRDGVLDYLIDTLPKYTGMELTLYLSSAAKEGEIVRPVAVFRVTGC